MTGYCQCGREHPQQRPRTDEWLVLQGTIDQLTTDLSKKQEEIDRLKKRVEELEKSDYWYVQGSLRRDTEYLGAFRSKEAAEKCADEARETGDYMYGVHVWKGMFGG